jgi:hypothetical protein
MANRCQKRRSETSIFGRPELPVVCRAQPGKKCWKRSDSSTFGSVRQSILSAARAVKGKLGSSPFTVIRSSLENHLEHPTHGKQLPHPLVARAFAACPGHSRRSGDDRVESACLLSAAARTSIGLLCFADRFFPNAACVVSLVDRLVHNAEMPAIEGASYRLKAAQERSERRAQKRRRSKS